MKKTNIQWCHSTVNPVMGCDGCELWPSPSKLASHISVSFEDFRNDSRNALRRWVDAEIGDRTTSEIYSDRERIAENLCASLKISSTSRGKVVDIIRQECKCYAGMLGTFRAGHKGYANSFDSPMLYPGRIRKAANWGPPGSKEVADKPWIAGLPRLIFLSDMGDALSKGVSFDYLREEVIEHVVSDSGRQHIWLWLSKRPGRMAEFGAWLIKEGLEWPDNLVAMTTVTRQEFASRVNELRRVPSKLKGLSVEPLCGPVDFDLAGIDWLIVGGGSDILADPFHVEWALSLREKCEQNGAAFFLKQLGRNAFFQEEPLALKDGHGGDWNEWPAEWRIRMFPKAFQSQEFSTLLGLSAQT